MTADPQASIRNSFSISIESLRGIAVIMVMLLHMQALNLGWAGVQLFFVISGFLITGVLLRHREQTIGQYLRYFYLFRILRIFPLYFFYLTLIALCFLKLGSANEFFKHPYYFILYLNNFLRFNADFILLPHYQHLWSLAVEQQFYLIFPFLVFYLSRRNLSLLLLLLIVVTPAVRYLIYALIEQRTDITSYVKGDIVHWNTLSHLDAFACGALISVAQLTVTVKRPALLLLMAALLFIVVGDFSLRHSSYPGSSFGYDMAGTQNYQYVWGYSVINILCMALITYLLQREQATVGQRGTFLLLRNRLLRRIGRVSYGMYIFHLILYVPVLSLASGLPRFLSNALYVVVVYGVAEASFYLIERPFSKIKERMR